MKQPDAWLDLTRKLDWEFTYVDSKDAFPEPVAGVPWLASTEWRDWDEPYRTTFARYVTTQDEKEAAVRAVRETVGRPCDFARLDRGWLSTEKLHAATLALAEFAAVIGNLRAARFGRDSAWRNTALLGALDELRHTQIPLLVFHDLVAMDPQFDWTHRFLHTNNWVAIAARHFVDELLLTTDPIEFAIGTHFVFETGFTNLEFVGLASMARETGDRMFEKMVQSIQTDEARHAQIGRPVLAKVLEHDPLRAQRLVDKWFWRSFQLFAVVTGFAMDYLTPLGARTASFREFTEEWIIEQFLRALEEVGLKRPWYWREFEAMLETYHHMMYVSAYTYRSTLWFDVVLPGPQERAWLREKYPRSWHELDPLWERITERWKAAPGVEWFTHGTTPVGFCDLCQLVLCAGTPSHNQARTVVHEGRKFIFCSAPCQWIFQSEPERYRHHQGVVSRILTGEAPGNLLELLRYFGLCPDARGRDVARGRYSFLRESQHPGGTS